ncbi:hypothetical protein ACEPPN_007378 [Leptodophora sp. 'Broadleaf-Isolate-01']
MVALLAAVLIPIFIKEGKKLFEERDQKKNAKREARNESPTSNAKGVQKSIGLAKKGYKKAFGKSKGKGKEDVYDGGFASPGGQGPVMGGYYGLGDGNISQNQQWRGQPGFQISRENMLGGDGPRQYGNQQYDPRYPHPAYVDNRSMQGHGKFQHDPRNYPGGQRHGGELQQHGGLVNGRHASDYDHERYRADYNRNQQKSFRRAGHGRYEENRSDHDGFGGTHRHEHQNGQRTSRSSDEDRKPENCENEVGDSGRKDFHGSSDSEDEGDAKSSVDQKARDTSVSHKRRA